MKTKYAVGLLVLFLGFVCHGWEYTLYGNAHVLSYSDLKSLHELSIGYTSADDLYKDYSNLRKSCGDNEILFEEKTKTDFANKLIKISGRVSKVRKSILDEYIVELETNELWAWNVGVVYPQKISQTMKNELMQLCSGDYFECLAITRNTYMYVDVPVWNQNGIYRTTP